MGCSPYWFRIMGFLPSPQGLRDLHIQKSTMSMLSVNTIEELEGISWRIVWLSKTRFNRWSTQIQPNSEDLSTVTRSIKIKDQLGAVLLWMFSFVNALLEKCKPCFDVNICIKWINLFWTPFVIMNFVDISKKGNKCHDHKVSTKKW